MANPEDTTVRVEVAYALPQRQELIALDVEHGCTALEAVRRSGIARRFPEIDPDGARLGIFAKPLDGTQLPLPGEYVLEEGDRVEIYRPLKIDPKAARTQRALKKQKKN